MELAGENEYDNKNEASETTGESFLRTLFYYNQIFMNMKVLKTILSFFVIIALCSLICSVVGFIFYWITGNANVFVLILFFGTLLLALFCGAFD